MAFTQIRITGSYEHAVPGQLAQGTVRLRLSKVMRDASTNKVIVQSDILAYVDTQGDIAVGGTKGMLVYATNDVTTEPQGVTYEVHEDISGAVPQAYRIVVDANAALGTMDLADVERRPL